MPILSAIFVTIVTVKFYINAGFLHFSHSSNKLIKSILFSRCPCVRASVRASVRNVLFP